MQDAPRCPPDKEGPGPQERLRRPQRDKVGQLTQEQLEEIAKVKMPDLNANDLEAAKKIVAGTARSMGVTIAD